MQSLLGGVDPVLEPVPFPAHRFEEPLSHCHCRGCARHRRHAGGDEQGVQEQPIWVVRSDVHRTAPHKNGRQLSRHH